MKTIHYLLITIFLFFTCELIAQEEIITVDTPEVELKGVLRVPESEKPMPIVLIIAGSGPTDRDGNNPQMINNSLKQLAEGLNKEEIATLNFDKRWVGESLPKEEVVYSEVVLEDYVDDANVLIDYLSQDSRFSKLIIVGHSEGSLIGMLTALRNEKVDAFVSLAGAGNPLDKILLEQLAAQGDFLVEIATPIVDQLKQRQRVDEFPPLLNNLFHPAVQNFIISTFSYNPSELIQKLNIPVLIVNGTTDIQVGVEQAEVLSKAKPDADLVIIGNMNHVLKEIDSDNRLLQMLTYTQADLPIKAELVPAISEFIQKKVNR